jgi:CHAD domain-containing protein
MEEFAFKSSDLSDEFHRVVYQQARRALDQLQSVSASDVGGIHGARKCFKRLRACYRLLKPSDRPTFRRGNRFFRDLSTQLSSQRDSQVMLGTLLGLCRDEPRLSSLPFLNDLIAALTSEQRQARENAAAQAVSVAESVRSFVHGDCQPGFAPLDMDSLRFGVTETYAEARRGWRLARRSGDDDDFHRWRKCAKYHWYQMRLVQVLWMIPEERLKRLDRLCSLLGDYHDLAVLKVRLAGAGDAEAWLREAIAGRQQTLSRQAEQLAKALFADTPRRYREWLDRRGK